MADQLLSQLGISPDDQDDPKTVEAIKKVLHKIFVAAGMVAKNLDADDTLRHTSAVLSIVKFLAKLTPEQVEAYAASLQQQPAGGQLAIGNGPATPTTPATQSELDTLKRRALTALECVDKIANAAGVATSSDTYTSTEKLDTVVAAIVDKLKAQDDKYILRTEVETEATEVLALLDDNEVDLNAFGRIGGAKDATAFKNDAVKKVRTRLTNFFKKGASK